MNILKNFNNIDKKQSKELSRQEFIQRLALYTSSVVLLPAVSTCKWFQGEKKLTVPLDPGVDWNPIVFNRERGNQGAIPKSYLPDINGPDGEKKHLGKHLPYVPQIDSSLVPEGYIPIMWGDPSKGYTKHPNAPKDNSKNYEGHWYDWIRIRKVSQGEATELQSTYSNWPNIGASDKGSYVAFSGKDITKDNGKNTVYLAALPKDIQKGDMVRIYAHCKTHGEWVDFITV